MVRRAVATKKCRSYVEKIGHFSQKEIGRFPPKTCRFCGNFEICVGFGGLAVAHREVLFVLKVNVGARLDERLDARLVQVAGGDVQRRVARRVLRTGAKTTIKQTNKRNDE